MKIKDIVTFVSKSITPKQGVTYNLYSLPSFDEGKTSEILDGIEIQSNKYDVPNKCILFNKLNIRFRRVWKVNNYDENKISSTEFLPLVVNESVVDFQYCYYLLLSDKITNYLCGQNTNTSGSHKRIDPNNFLDIEITLPKMSIQKQIGKTLSALEHKIELNKRINDNFTHNLLFYILCMIRHNRLIQISIRKSGRCLKMENKGSQIPIKSRKIYHSSEFMHICH